MLNVSVDVIPVAPQLHQRCCHVGLNDQNGGLNGDVLKARTCAAQIMLIVFVFSYKKKRRVGYKYTLAPDHTWYLFNLPPPKPLLYCRLMLVITTTPN